MEKNYYMLYLKYKNKYLKLKNSIGAAYTYKEDATNIHRILKQIFIKDLCEKIKKIIFDSLDSDMKKTLNFIITTDCTIIIKNINEPSLLKLIDHGLIVFINLYNKFIINNEDLTFKDIDKLFFILVELFRIIFGISRLITEPIKLLSRTIIPDKEINKNITPEIKKQIKTIIPGLLQIYNSDKTKFTDTIVSCILNSISALPSNSNPTLSDVKCNIEQLVSIINILKPLLKKNKEVSYLSDTPKKSIFEQPNFKQPNFKQSRDINFKLLNKENILNQSDINRIKNIKEKIDLCKKYLIKTKDKDKITKLNLKIQELESVLQTKTSHKELFCIDPSLQTLK